MTLGRAGAMATQLRLEIAQIVVGENHLLAAALAYALDHGGMVELVGQDDEARHEPAQGSTAPLRSPCSPS